MMKKEIGAENFVFVALFLGFFSLFAVKMGLMNAINTMMNTAYALLIDTVLYLTAMCVIMGALSALFSEFGLVALMNKLLRPLMVPIYRLPGAAALGIVTTFLSDNPAILSLAQDDYFKSLFKKYQFPALTNLATSFGMGMIVCTYMLSLSTVTGGSLAAPVLIGLLGAILGSVVSTRLMLHKTEKIFGSTEMMTAGNPIPEDRKMRPIRPGGVGNRALSAILDGGAAGVQMGLSIVPGTLVICTFVMMLTKSVGGAGIYTGAAYEGIALLPGLAERMSFVLGPLFGFSSPEAISVPITALGAAGASLSVARQLLGAGLIGANDICVYTAMCMCWSGYLSTHVSMMDSLHSPELAGKAILYHTLGGLCAGVSAHWMYLLFCALRAV